MARRPRRILVVDDIADWRKTLSKLLTCEGYQVQEAESVDSALAALEACSFDLAMVDVRLDDADESNEQGLELAGIIKRDWPTVKVVIVTGYPTLDTVNRALRPMLAGSKLADGYIEKNNLAELPQFLEHVFET